MQTQQHEVLEGISNWLHSDADCWLCAVVATVGSSPRPVGSLAALHRDGRQIGSLSGGCIEEDLARRLLAGEYDSPAPQRVEYGVTAEENERLGLPCGGRLTLLVQRLQRADQAWLSETLRSLRERECIERHVDLGSGSTELQRVPAFTPLRLDEKTLRQCFGPQMRMLLVGAGQLAHSVAELAQAMDYEVIVTDPREEVLRQWAGPDVRRLGGMPDDVASAHAADAQSVVITLTHDPRIDDMALMQALETDAWYVGALGSERTTKNRLLRLRELGVSETNLARLHAPVGLPIGSKTPVEIAVAIMAQLTQLRRSRAT